MALPVKSWGVRIPLGATVAKGAANKIKGVRAVLAHDSYTAHQSVEHDQANVLTVGSRVIGSMLAKEVVIAFLNARFTGEDRHVRRLRKITDLEERFVAG